MRPAPALAAFLVACAGPTATGAGAGESGDVTHAQLAPDEAFVPTYGTPELQKALIADRGSEASLEAEIAGLQAKDHDAASDDHLRTLEADLAVRRRFIATLETCEASGRWCPPRLDDPAFAFDPDADGQAPPLTAGLRFDLDGWQRIATELHGRACACRTLACVDAIGAAIDQLEQRPTHEVAGDDTASLATTRARECLYRLRGKAPIVSVHED